MTPAWIDTSSADTGSSSTITSRIEHERTGDSDTLALPAGELVRIAVGVLGRQPDGRQQVADLGRALRLSLIPRWTSSGSLSVSPTVRRGFSEA